MGKRDKRKKNQNEDKKESKKKRQDDKTTKKLKKKDVKRGEIDFDKIIAEFQKKEAEKTAVVISVVPQPSPRLNFSMTPTGAGDLIMFGGEYYNGQDSVVFNELYRWNIEKNEWKLIQSLNTPPPRCSHQAVLYRDYLYIFGGEFSTSDEFYHYRDLWRLDLKTNRWEELKPTGKAPSARSGHRMCVWRNYIILFGGFYESLRERKWFNDLYIFNLQDMAWQQVAYPAHANIPQPRSGCQLALFQNDDLIFMYGGFSVTKESSKMTQGKIHDDMWALHLRPLATGATPTWEKVSKKGQYPTPRSGAVMTVYKSRAILFGGVFDQEADRYAFNSIFYNDLYSFDMPRKCWFKLSVGEAKQKQQKRRKGKNKDHTENGEDSNEIDQDNNDNDDDDDNDNQNESEEEIDINENTVAYIDNRGQFVYVNVDDDEDENGNENDDSSNESDHDQKTQPSEETKGKIEKGRQLEKNERKKEDKNITNNNKQTTNIFQLNQTQSNDQTENKQVDLLKPLPRINPALVVKGQKLYLYGGMIEDGDRQITLDDCWSINMNGNDNWVCITEGTYKTQEWKAEVIEEGDEEGDELNDDDDDENYAESGDDDDDDDDDDYESDDDNCIKEEEEGEDKEEEEKKEIPEIEQKTTDKQTAVEEQKGSSNNDHEKADEGSDNEKKKKKKHKKKSKDNEEKDGDDDEKEKNDDQTDEKKKKKKKKNTSVREEIREIQQQLDTSDSNRTPKSEETLAEFFKRTSEYWTELVIENLKKEESNSEQQIIYTAKELRKLAFALSEIRYEELKPILARLNELEQQQKESEQKNLLQSKLSGRSTKQTKLR